MPSNFFTELVLHLKSDYPVIFIVTAEEKRALAELERACKTVGVSLLLPRTPGTLVPLAEQIASLKQSDTVILFNDIHRRLNEPDALRLLGDFDSAGNLENRTAVVITPWVDIPPDLERISAVIELPLPDINELGTVLNDVCAETGVLLNDNDIESMVRVGQGLTSGEAKRAFTRALLGWPENTRLAKESVEKDKRRAMARSNVLEHVQANINFDDVGGMDHLKKWLNARRKAFSLEAREYGLPIPKGLMLMGIQGCGKSLAAKAIGGFWELPVVRLDIFAVFGQEHAEESLRTALKTTEAMAPCVLWIDEIEKGFDNEGSGKSSRLLGGLITWLQEKQKEVFVVATANKVEALPPELARKGRFDEIFFVDLPASAERKEILELHLKKKKLDVANYDISNLIARTEKMTGSELEQLVIAAMYTAFERNEKPTQADFVRAIQNTVTLYATFEKDIKKLREWARTHARIASSDRSKIDYFK